MIGANAVTINFADSRRQCTQLGRNAIGQFGATQPFGYLLPRKIVIALVVEGDDHERQAKLCVREHADGVGGARQRHLNRYGDLTLDFFGSAARVQGNDRDLGIGHIRKCLDRQILERDQATTDKQ